MSHADPALVAFFAPNWFTFAQLAAAHETRRANNRMTTLWHLGGTLTHVRRAVARVDDVTVAKRTTRIEVRRKDWRVLGHADVPSAWVVS